MATSDDSMSGEEFRAAVARLGFAGEHPTDSGLSAAARWLGKTERTARAWAADGVPAAEAKLLRLMLAVKLTPAEVDAAIAKAARRRR